MASTYFTRTPGSGGNRRTFTFSTWIKRSDISARFQLLFCANNFSGSNLNSQIFFNQSNQLATTVTNNGTNVSYLLSTQLFRDVSAWYHIVIAYDTTQATDTNRVKMYVNGAQIIALDTATYPTQNLDTAYNQISIPQVIGYRHSEAANYYTDGLLANTILIDGQQLTPSSFGQTDSTTGIWKPKPYSGSYGTNGFFLKYENSGSLGTDSSGNGNNFTVTAGTPTQILDTPSNVFATINILTCNDTASLTAANGNLTITGGNDMGATINISKGRWYWESKRSNTGTVAHWGIGFTQSWYTSTQIANGNGSGYFIRDDFSGGLNVSNSGSNGFTNISTSSTGSSVANGDIIGVALDLDSATKSVTFYQNGSQVAAGTFSYDGTTTFCTPYVRNNSGAQSQWNFGNGYFGSTAISSPYSDGAGLGKFQYQPPAGYYALCTKNINVYG